MKMKRQVLNSRTAPQATPLVQKMMKMNYEFTERDAQTKNGNDTVYKLYNPKTKFTVEFCTKTSVSGKDYLCWAKVWGPEELVEKFLVAINYAPAPVVKVEVSQKQFNF